ncbi:unnamed protein product [Ilex paraguariensis]|uniref:Uncharacterized protein n=1 Tax=Ilex paraguariensis TaxID=185542 RepID=A0ABC8R9W2_9AQUA
MVEDMIGGTHKALISIALSLREEVRMLQKDISSGSSSVGGFLVLIKGKEGKVKRKTDDDEVKQKNGNEVVVDDYEVPNEVENSGSSLFAVALEMARRSCHNEGEKVDMLGGFGRLLVEVRC